MDQKQISDRDLENVSGGLIFDAGTISGSDPSRPGEVLDNKSAEVMMRFVTEEEAIRWVTGAYGNNYENTRRVDYDEVLEIRNNHRS